MNLLVSDGTDLVGGDLCHGDSLSIKGSEFNPRRYRAGGILDSAAAFWSAVVLYRFGSGTRRNPPAGRLQPVRNFPIRGELRLRRRVKQGHRQAVEQRKPPPGLHKIRDGYLGMNRLRRNRHLKMPEHAQRLGTDCEIKPSVSHRLVKNRPAILPHAGDVFMPVEAREREVAEISVLNNNYLDRLLMGVRGVSRPYAEGHRRLDQVRYSLETLKEETGVGTEDVRDRMVDFGIQSYWMSHHPWVVPEPFTPEPCETYSKADLDEWAAVVKKASDEAYADAAFVKSSPHSSSSGRMTGLDALEDPRSATTWRSYRRKIAPRG